MSTIKTATYTNDDGGTYAYDPRVIVEGARVRTTVWVNSHHPGDDTEVRVYADTPGTVLDYADAFYQCLVRLDTARPTGSDVWIAPDDLALITPRYEFDRDEAARVLQLIETECAENGWLTDGFDALPADHHDDATCISLDGFDPGDSTESESQIGALLRVAWGTWLTGPAEPYFNYDRAGDCHTYEAHLGQHPAQVRVVSGWEDTKHIVDRDEKGNHVTNTAAALSILDTLTNRLNAALIELDNYVAAKVAEAAAAAKTPQVLATGEFDHDETPEWSVVHTVIQTVPADDADAAELKARRAIENADGLWWPSVTEGSDVEPAYAGQGA